MDSAIAAWGVDLGNGYGSAVADTWEFEQTVLPALPGVEPGALPVSFPAYGYGADGGDSTVLVLNRSLTITGPGLEEIDLAKLAPPSAAEEAVVNQVLDRLGHTGPRAIKRLLAL